VQSQYGGLPNNEAYNRDWGCATMKTTFQGLQLEATKE